MSCDGRQQFGTDTQCLNVQLLGETGIVRYKGGVTSEPGLPVRFRGHGDITAPLAIGAIAQPDVRFKHRFEAIRLCQQCGFYNPLVFFAPLRHPFIKYLPTDYTDYTDYYYISLCEPLFPLFSDPPYPVFV